MLREKLEKEEEQGCGTDGGICAWNGKYLRQGQLLGISNILLREKNNEKE